MPGTGDVVRAVVKFDSPFSSQIQNVWHYVVQDVLNIDGGSILQAVGDHLDLIYSNLNLAINQDVLLDSILVYIVDYINAKWVTTQYLGQVDEMNSVNFADAGAPLPASNAYAVRFGTMLPGHMGRKYFGGFGEAANDVDGTPLVSTQGLVLAAATQALIGPTLSTGPGWLDPSIPMYNGAQATSLATAVVPNSWSVQKRRRTWIGI